MDVQTFAQRVGRQVSNALTVAGITRNEAATRAGIPATTFRRKVLGDAEFTLGELTRLAEIANVSPRVLLPDEFDVAV